MSFISFIRARYVPLKPGQLLGLAQQSLQKAQVHRANGLKYLPDGVNWGHANTMFIAVRFGESLIKPGICMLDAHHCRW
jgi:hypothetical protein